jgi:hypothetical protein
MTGKILSYEGNFKRTLRPLLKSIIKGELALAEVSNGIVSFEFSFYSRLSSHDSRGRTQAQCMAAIIAEVVTETTGSLADIKETNSDTYSWFEVRDSRGRVKVTVFYLNEEEDNATEE